MITFIGLGLWDEKSMSLEALEAAQDCDLLYAEFYTSRLIGADLEKLEKKIGKKIEVLDREEVESGKKILEAGKTKKTGFLVGGDALTATTHIDLFLDAKKAGIETRVVHGTSIYTAAAGLTGLQIYKFGRSGSIPYPEKGFAPESPYDIVKENQKAGLHTLLFLDIKTDRLMTANDAMEILLGIEDKRKEKVFTEKTEIVVIARAGSEKALVKFGKVRDLLEQDFGGPMHALIVPGKLHFKEEEGLELWK